MAGRRTQFSLVFMEIVVAPRHMHDWIRNNPARTSRGLVPTMGALHRGHEALIQQSRSDNDQTILSLFVNPTQFNVPSDFEKYPRNYERDLAIAEHHGVDVVYMPTTDNMYRSDFHSYVEPSTASVPMEGANRPGHFRGVTTVVTKLFNATLPDRAYFGKKDFQQLAVIRQLVDELDFPIQIIGVDTVRDHDGLALSSRNTRLSPQARQDASIIFKALTDVKQSFNNGERDVSALLNSFRHRIAQSTLINLEYVEISDARTLQPLTHITQEAVLCVAAWYDDVRLIDNIELSVI